MKRTIAFVLAALLALTLAACEGDEGNGGENDDDRGNREAVHDDYGLNGMWIYEWEQYDGGSVSVLSYTFSGNSFVYERRNRHYYHENPYDFRVPYDLHESIVAGGAAEDQTGFNGVWPYGMYAEPFNGTNYDGEINTIATTTGIQEGALMFGLYHLDFATFTVISWGEGPEEIEGYTRVDNPGNLRPGEWTAVKTGAGYTYLFLVPHDGYVHLADGQTYRVGLPFELIEEGRDERGEYRIYLLGSVTGTFSLTDNTMEFIPDDVVGFWLSSYFSDAVHDESSVLHDFHRVGYNTIEIYGTTYTRR